jgi:hypothetical protein
MAIMPYQQSTDEDEEKGEVSRRRKERSWKVGFGCFGGFFIEATYGDARGLMKLNRKR